MRRIISIVSLSLALAGGGSAALASPRGEHAVAARREIREPLRDRFHRPELRYERHELRPGLRWEHGDWRWAGREWRWSPGRYVRR